MTEHSESPSDFEIDFGLMASSNCYFRKEVIARYSPPRLFWTYSAYKSAFMASNRNRPRPTIFRVFFFCNIKRRKSGYIILVVDPVTRLTTGLEYTVYTHPSVSELLGDPKNVGSDSHLTTIGFPVFCCFSHSDRCMLCARDPTPRFFFRDI